ncbi:hypothetical protein [Ciceribacter sp. L1K22]|uniref:hypothetical protein n=1 Tax=Ciceribacter sp. L1K22 TaxID=2820275 RepID=UPI001ABDC0DA|nr:hypothetical protein [Ciceribacter sp. L1K22]MBO3760025.1 hypothetical protein [Ciceribacter sp. L1K22]
MVRRKRPAKLNTAAVDEIVAAAGSFCSALTGNMRHVAPGCDHYQAISVANHATLDAVQKLTGKPAPWIATPPGNGPWCGRSEE